MVKESSIAAVCAALLLLSGCKKEDGKPHTEVKNANAGDSSGIIKQYEFKPLEDIYGSDVPVSLEEFNEIKERLTIFGYGINNDFTKHIEGSTRVVIISPENHQAEAKLSEQRRRFQEINECVGVDFVGLESIVGEVDHKRLERLEQAYPGFMKRVTACGKQADELYDLLSLVFDPRNATTTQQRGHYDLLLTNLKNKVIPMIRMAYFGSSDALPRIGIDFVPTYTKISDYLGAGCRVIGMETEESMRLGYLYLTCVSYADALDGLLATYELELLISPNPNQNLKNQIGEKMNIIRDELNRMRNTASEYISDTLGTSFPQTFGSLALNFRSSAWCDTLASFKGRRFLAMFGGDHTPEFVESCTYRGFSTICLGKIGE